MRRCFHTRRHGASFQGADMSAREGGLRFLCSTSKSRFRQDPHLVTNRIRNGAAALFLIGCLVTLKSAFNLPNRSPNLSSQLASLSMAAKRAQQHAMLTLADRVAYQRAIEEVYWRHRIWPKERPDPKPSLDQVMSSAQLEKKVQDYLRDSEALEDYWQEPLSAEQLQAEMERMAKHTKQPEVLRELFEALGNDPFVIAECLARPVLSERLLTNFYAHDQRFHGQLRQRAEAELRSHHTVRQMKQTSGKYSEIELVRSDSAQDEESRGAETSVKMNSPDWDENVQKLAAMFGDAKNGPAQLWKSSRAEPPVVPTTQIKTGVFSPLQEDEGRYYATAIVKKTKDHLKLATVEWRKEPLESWKAKAESQLPKIMAAVTANYILPTISDGAAGCTDDTWTTTTTTSTPSGRRLHTAVWTGSEMIVWGGDIPGNTGGRYTPSTDTWTPTSLNNAPTARESQTAVWTGTEMIVWGGLSDSGALNTGGRYNPGTDSWIATSTTNAPTGRYLHTAVWTGSEMIVWGGYFFNGIGNYLNTGGRYDPSTDSWTPTSITNVPTGRYLHTAVWTDSEMIVWGGYRDDLHTYFNTGGRYNPSTDSWTSTSIANVPDGRNDHTAVWSGSEMVVWGGLNDTGALNTGGRYSPGTDTWTPTSITNVPTGRYEHTAVWTGSEMIIWGGLFYNGVFNNLNTGGTYNPAMDSWTATSINNAPTGREIHTAVWTGSEMIVWGGAYFNGFNFTDLNTGGRYNPSTDSWTATNTGSVPSARYLHKAVWSGSEMIVWGGWNGSFLLNSGGRYNPGTDSWTATSTTNAPSARDGHTAVWTGSEMIIWGGHDILIGFANTGGRYNPGADSWTATSTANAPIGRDGHTAVWTGIEMIVWGGENGNSGYLNTGGRYNPRTDTWAATSTTNAPTARYAHTAVWSGSEMIVWGGTDASSYFDTGGRYNSSTDSWTATSTTNVPTARAFHTAVWNGNVIVWGGFDSSGNFNTGGVYSPGTDTWTPTSTTNAPNARAYHTAVWSGSEMIVWGGTDASSYFDTGGRYNPSTDTWTTTSMTNVPSGRIQHTAVWSGSEMIVWGGYDGAINLNTGGRYCAQSPAPMAQSAFSRKTHGAAGTFDVPLPLTGNVGVECRSGGETNDYQMIINFATSVTVESASVTSGTGSVSGFTVNGSEVTVNLTGVINVQRITVTLFNVNDGTHVGDVAVSMGVLIGDVNGNAVVNSSDVSLTKSQVGQPVSGSNFREDVNTNGLINSVDVALVKSKVGTALPP